MSDPLVKFHDFSKIFCPYFKIPWLFHGLGHISSEFHDFSKILKKFKIPEIAWLFQDRGNPAVMIYLLIYIKKYTHCNVLYTSSSICIELQSAY